MKKRFLIVGILAVLAAAAIGVGAAFAQSPTQASNRPFDGMRGRGQGGSMGGQVLHPFMEAAMAEALGMSVEELQAAHADGKTGWEIAQAQGQADSEIQKIFVDARSKALAAAVTAGVITQEQADAMLSHFGQMDGYGSGQGACDGTGAGMNAPGSHMGGRGGRNWNTLVQP